MKDNISIKYNRLVFIEDVENHVLPCGSKARKSKWLCDCGNIKDILHASVKRGAAKSCGCLHKERSSASMSKTMKKHGMTGTPIYTRWQSMLARCLNKNDPNYQRYGGRGITVCDKWLKFEEYYKDVGDPPSKNHNIDRKNNNLGYFKENCRWVTYNQNAQNTRSSKRWIIDNVCYLSSNFAAKALNISPATVMYWCDGGICSGRIRVQKENCYSIKVYG